MEQKQTKKLAKAMCAVWIILHENEYVPLQLPKKNRKYPSKKILPAKTNVKNKEFIYLEVTKMYTSGDLVHIHCGKHEKHTHKVSDIKEVRMREYDRSGRIM